MMQRIPAVVAAVAAAAIACLAATAASPAPAPGATRSASAVAPTGSSAAHVAFPVGPVAQAPGGAGAGSNGMPVAAASAAPDLAPLESMIAPLATTGHDLLMTTPGSRLTSSVDPSSKTAGAIATSPGISLDQIVAGGRIYLKANLGADLDKEVGITPNAWMTIDPAKINRSNNLLIQPDASDPIDLKGILTGVTALTPAGAHRVNGFLDLTKVTGHTRPDPQEVEKAGAKAKHVPFTAVADAQGRIEKFTVSADAFDPELSLDVAYSKYGAPTPVQVPTAARPAPDAVYTLFNG